MQVIKDMLIHKDKYKYIRTSLIVSEVTETPTADPWILDKSFSPYFASSTSLVGS